MFYVSTDRTKFTPEAVQILLKQTYWAKDRDIETIRASMENSLCFGVFLSEDDTLIGFARAITDYATTFYLADVIIHEKYRGIGAGKALIDSVVNNELVGHLRGHLITKDAHGLYEKYGFVSVHNKYMGKDAKKK